MKKDISEHVSKCLTCQQVKAEQRVPSDLLNPLPIPQWKWDDVTIDFVSSFPLTQRKHDPVKVISRTKFIFKGGGGGGENCNTPKYTLVIFKHN